MIISTWTWLSIVVDPIVDFLSYFMGTSRVGPIKVPFFECFVSKTLFVLYSPGSLESWLIKHVFFPYPIEVVGFFRIG